MRTSELKKDEVICDFCQQEGRVSTAQKKCVFCDKDICENHSKGQGNYFNSDNWPVGDDKTGICPDCYEMLGKHKYNKKPASWISVKTDFRESFLEIYNKKTEESNNKIRKEMRQMLADVFSEVEKAQKDNIAIEKKKMEYEREIAELEKRKKSLSS